MDIKENILPWHEQQWAQLINRQQQGRLPHSILLAGPQGLGKGVFAQAFAARLLCHAPTEKGQACGQCKSCQLIEAGTHPDLHIVERAEDSKVIKIDQIRGFCEVLSHKAQLSGFRVGVINPADKMNVNAANSLLKTLEEPGEQTVILLVSSQPGSLPATIRSRCQKLNFGQPSLQDSKKWLEMQGVNDNPELLLRLTNNAPLQAIAFQEQGMLEQRSSFISDFNNLKSGLQNPLQLADKWHKQAPENCLQWLLSWVMDLIRLKSGSGDESVTNYDTLQHLQAVVRQIDLQSLFGYLEQIQRSSRHIQTQVNSQLLLEDLFISWIRLR